MFPVDPAHILCVLGRKNNINFVSRPFRSHGLHFYFKTRLHHNIITATNQDKITDFQLFSRIFCPGKVFTHQNFDITYQLTVIVNINI